MGVFHKAYMIARELRNNQTPAEKLFWQYVRKRQFYGLKFRRQQPLFYQTFQGIRFFIADFYCKSKNLVVEIDGGIHEQQKDYDKHRSEILSKQNDLRVIRFQNDLVLNDIENVLKKLAVFLGFEN